MISVQVTASEYARLKHLNEDEINFVVALAGRMILDEDGIEPGGVYVFTDEQMNRRDDLVVKLVRCFPRNYWVKI